MPAEADVAVDASPTPLVKSAGKCTSGVERSASGSRLDEPAPIERESAPELAADIAHLRSLLTDDLPPEFAPHLLGAVFLERSLQSKKLCRDKAEAVVRNYAIFCQLQDWNTVNAAGVLREARTGFNTLLPCTDVGGRVVLTQRMAWLDLRRRDPETGKSTTSIEAYQRMAYYLLHRALRRADPHAGMALLIDFCGFSGSQVTRMRLSDFRRGIAMVEDSFPAHLDCIYVLHPPAWISRLLLLLRPLLRRSSLSKKLVVLHREEDLFEHISAARLPAEFGGELQAEPWDETLDRWVQQERAWQDAEAAKEGARGEFDCLALVAGGMGRHRRPAPANRVL